MKVIILTTCTSPRQPGGVERAHRLYAVKDKMREEWTYQFEVIHTDEYSMLVVHGVEYKAQADMAQKDAKRFWEEGEK